MSENRREIRGRRSGATNRGSSEAAATRTGRTSREPLERVLADIDRMITVLINENRDLQRQVDRLSRQAAGAPSAAADRILRSLQRRISSAAGVRSAPRRRGAEPASGAGTRRKITDPALLERRRQALVKARAARAAKRAEASHSGG